MDVGDLHECKAPTSIALTSQALHKGFSNPILLKSTKSCKKQLLQSPYLGSILPHLVKKSTIIEKTKA
jgi:hypothetical protein